MSIPVLWTEAIAGGLHDELRDKLAERGVALERKQFSTEALSDFFDLMMLGRLNPFRGLINRTLTQAEPASADYMSRTPFRFSMLTLGRYLSTN
jgi:hypothetical protein